MFMWIWIDIKNIIVTGEFEKIFNICSLSYVDYTKIHLYKYLYTDEYIFLYDIDSEQVSFWKEDQGEGLGEEERVAEE